MNQPQVNPATTAAILQLSIEGHPNFAHCLLNTYTSLEENKQDIKSSIKIIGSEPIAPLHELFPEYQWLNPAKGDDGLKQVFELPISCRPNIISDLRRVETAFFKVLSSKVLFLHLIMGGLKRMAVRLERSLLKMRQQPVMDL